MTTPNMITKSIAGLGLALFSLAAATAQTTSPPLTLEWEHDMLSIRGDQLSGKELKILYLEAYCRADSQTTDWVKHTVVGHKTKLITSNDNHTELKLQCTLS